MGLSSGAFFGSRLNMEAFGKSRKWSQVLPAFIATFGAFGCGTGIAWPSVVQQQIECSHDNSSITSQNSTNCELGLSSAQFANVASFFHIGCAVVGPCAALLTRQLGRKWTMVLLALPFMAGLTLIITASGEWMLDLGRFLFGFSGGAFALLAPAYTVETVEPGLRGALASLQQLMASFGVFFSGLVGKFVTWQTLSGLLIVAPALMAVGLVFMPRSPVFLLSKGKVDEAKKALLFLRGPDFDVNSEMKEMEQSLEDSKAVGSISLLTLLTNRVYLMPFLISMVAQFLQQFCGINAVFSYAVTIFEDAKVDLDAYVCNILVAVTQIVFTAVSMVFVDRLGRRVLLVASELVMCSCLIAIGVYFYLKSKVDPGSSDTLQAFTPYVTQETIENIAMVPLVAVLLFVAGFSIGLGPIPWVINAELFPKEAKNIGASLCASFNWFCAFLVVRFYPSAVEAFHVYNTYFFFGGVCLLGVIFVILAVPETKGKTEEDMKAYFSGRRRS